MLILPAALLSLLVEFVPLCFRPVWKHAQVLLVGALLAPGKRTVTACLRVMGLSQETRCVHYHRLLNRARWSALTASYILPRLLVMTCVHQGTLVFGLDDTIERRRGAHIKAKESYRDQVRSSHAHFVKASGLRWLCCLLLVDVPWASSIWGLPVLTALCPSERSHTERGRQHQRLPARAWQIRQLIRRWLPTRIRVFVVASSCVVLDLLGAVSRTPWASVMTRSRLDAALWAPAPVMISWTRRATTSEKRTPPQSIKHLDDAKTA